MTATSAAVSVDLDTLREYAAIHGAAPAGKDPVYGVALDRMAAFAADHGVPLTLFAIGRDLADERNAVRLRQLAAAGHLVESHSFTHRYDLSRLTFDAIVADLRQAQDAIEAVTGRRPVGFRAPGYTTSATLFRALAEVGFAFDSSVFPCPSYYLAKLSVLAYYRLTGRTSASLVASPKVVMAPAQPYRLAGITELPIGVTRGLRLPFIGTTLTLAGPTVARLLARMVGPFANLELHAIDFLDQHDGLSLLAAQQPDLAVPWPRKRAALAAAVDELRRQGARFVTLADAADEHASGRRCA